MRAFFACALLTFAAIAAHADELPQEAFPRIETGRHTAPIHRIAVDAAGKWLVTGSEDKTARVWDLARGEQVRVLRPPVGNADLSKVLAVAITSDGKTIAVGGITLENVVYLFDRASGKLVRRLTGATAGVAELAFSPDGARLVAGLIKGGLHVWHTKDGKDLGADDKCAEGVYGLSFDKVGRLVTSCTDGKLRLYSAKLELVTEVKAPSGSQPYGVEFSRDGEQIAVGYADGPALDVLSGKDLSPLFKPSLKGFQKSSLLKAVWSPDGKYLYAGGTAHVIRIWEDGGKGKTTDVAKGGSDLVTDLMPLRTGAVYSLGDPAWAVVLPDGTRKDLIAAAQPDFHGIGENLLVSPDGLRVRFPFQAKGRKLAEFDVSTLMLDPAPKDDPSMRPARTTAEKVDFGTWRGEQDLKLNGQSLGLDKEVARTLAISADGTFFAVGVDHSLNGFSLRDGKPVWARLVPAAPAATDVSSDGRFVVTAYTDGTIRWQRARDGEELLALFVHPDQKRWILFTPTGYYEASSGGENLVGWIQNQGPDKAAELLPMKNFSARMHRPDVIANILRYQDEGLALEYADQAKSQPAADKDP